MSKKRFLLRLDPALYKTLEKWAADDLRSVNAQIEFLLTQATRQAGRTKQQSTTAPPISDQQNSEEESSEEESSEEETSEEESPKQQTSEGSSQ